MNKFVPIARFLFAIAIFFFGIQHFIYSHFLPDLESVPAWLRNQAIPAWIMGLLLIATAFCISTQIKDRQAAKILGVVCLFNALVVHLPRVIADPHNGNEWTTCFELLAICSGALVLAGILRKKSPAGAPVTGWDRFTGRLIIAAPYFFAASLFVYTMLHFVYADYIATLIPSWIPARLFLSYFVGVAFLASAIGIAIKKAGRLAAMLMGIMFYTWFLILHLPRVIASPQTEAEWTSAFVALAIGSTAWMLAAVLPE
jgi:uncharacterized membrane protein